MFKEKWAPFWLNSTQQICGKSLNYIYIQGWLHNLQGPVQNENAGFLVQQAEKRSVINSPKIKSFFFKNALFIMKHNRDNNDTWVTT